MTVGKHVDLYVIKEHKVSPFTWHMPDEYLVGYITDLDLHTLAYRTCNGVMAASLLTLPEAAKAIAKLNKLNMRYFEICKFEPTNPPNED